jgi:hypothetical protein
VSKCWKQEKSLWKRVGCVQPTTAQSGCTGLSGGAPESVRCTRTSLGEQSALGTRWRCTAIIHRTVRWCTGLSGEPTVDCANGWPRNPRVTRGRANGQMGHQTVQCASDSVWCANVQVFNGRLRQFRKAICTRHATVPVRWCTGLSDAPPDRRQELPSLIASNDS